MQVISDLPEIGTDKAKIFCTILKDMISITKQINSQKATKLASVLNELLEHYSCDFDARSMLNCCIAFPMMKLFGRGDLFAKWTSLTIQRIR